MGRSKTVHPRGQSGPRWNLWCQMGELLIDLWFRNEKCKHTRAHREGYGILYSVWRGGIFSEISWNEWYIIKLLAEAYTDKAVEQMWMLIWQWEIQKHMWSVIQARCLAVGMNAGERDWWIFKLSRCHWHLWLKSAALMSVGGHGQRRDDIMKCIVH